MAKPYWIDKSAPLTKGELQQLETCTDAWSGTIPAKPNGGDVYCYQSPDESKNGAYSNFTLNSNHYKYLDSTGYR